ncbi:MAG: citrate transporter [Acidobacteria bacterium]|nr:citrate transporter [Acidobacteriota bacterium]
MLTLFGILTVVTLLVLVLARITSVLVALVLVPLATGLLAGLGSDVGVFALSGVESVAGTATMLGFAVLYFGLMNDAGLFAPLIRAVVRFGGADPVRIVMGTAVVGMLAHLDGSGASTFLIAIPALLPIYERLGLDRSVLAATVALSAGTLNVVPWGGPTLRAATVLQVDVLDLFRPLLPSLVAGLVTVLALAAWLGRSERRRLAAAGTPSVETNPTTVPEPESAPVPRWLFAFNVVLTVLALVGLVQAVLPLPIIFMTAYAVALVVNCPAPQAQRDQLVRHAGPAMTMVGLILAAGVFAGILRESCMITAMGQSLVDALPATLTGHPATLTALAAMPLSLAFDPDSFYFGVLPVIASAADIAGGSGVEVARAALLGQMTTGFPVSPLTPATFLLIGMSGVDLADHQRKTIPLAYLVTLVMSLVALATGAFSF